MKRFEDGTSEKALFHFAISLWKTSLGWLASSDKSTVSALNQTHSEYWVNAEQNLPHKTPTPLYMNGSTIIEHTIMYIHIHVNNYMGLGSPAGLLQVLGPYFAGLVFAVCR